MTDYIGGYLMLPGSLATLFGSVTGIVTIILAVGILILFLLFLITHSYYFLQLIERCKRMQRNRWMLK